MKGVKDIIDTASVAAFVFVLALVVSSVGAASVAQPADTAAGTRGTVGEPPVSLDAIIGQLEASGVDASVARAALENGENETAEAWLESSFWSQAPGSPARADNATGQPPGQRGMPGSGGMMGGQARSNGTAPRVNATERRMQPSGGALAGGNFTRPQDVPPNGTAPGGNFDNRRTNSSAGMPPGEPAAGDDRAGNTAASQDTASIESLMKAFESWLMALFQTQASTSSGQNASAAFEREMGPPPGRTTTGGGSSSSSSYTLSGAYTLGGGTKTETGATYTSDTDDASAIYVTNGGELALISPRIATSGDTSSQEASSFYGLNAAVLADDGSTITITGGTIATSGTGANGAFPTGSGSSIVLSEMTITATGNGSHGVMATNGGSLTLDDVDITTSGSNSAPVATDRGSGTVTVTGGTITASGTDSPGIYSTGVITVADATVTATGSEAAVIEGSNSIALADTEISGAEGSGDRGIMIYQSMSGDADIGVGSFTMTGGSYTWPSASGPAFYVTNTNAAITLTDVDVASSSPILLAASADRWGSSGSNGGSVTFTADGVALTGSIVADSISSIAVVLEDGTTLSGAIDSAALTLDATSTWNVTGDSQLKSLSDASGISCTSIANIVGNGYTVTYDASLGANSALGGKTYTLADGGQLVPQ